MATFLIQAKIDPKQAVAGARIVKGSMVGLQRQANVLRGAMARAFGVIGLAAGIKTSIDLMADFSLAITTAAAVSTRDFKYMEGNMAALREEARKLGATTKFTATEAAEGMLYLARAGFTVSENLATARGALNLAQAGNIGLGRAADIVTNIMAGFSVEVDQASRFIDVVGKTANSANTNIQQLGDALKFAGPVAAAVGVEVEEAAAAVAALSDAGLQGTLAGTGFRRVLSELEAPSIKATKFLKHLGLSQQDVSVTTNGLVPVIEKLIKAGFDVGDALEFFGDRGGPAFQVIANAVKKGYIQQMTELNKKAKGSVDELAAAMDATLKGALWALKSAFESLILSIGELGAESKLQEYVRGLTEILRAAGRNIEQVSKYFRALAIVIGVVLAKKAIVFAIKMMTRLWAITKANPYAVLTLAIVAAAAALYEFSDQIKISEDSATTLRDVFTAAMEDIKGQMSVAGEFWGNVMTVMASDNAEGLSVVTSDFAIFIVSMVRTIDGGIGGFNALVIAFISVFEKIPAAAKDAVVTAINYWIEKLEIGINTINRKVNEVRAFFGQDPLNNMVNLERLKLDGEDLGLEDLAKQFSEILLAGTAEPGILENMVKGWVERANQIAKLRAIEAKKKSKDTEPDPIKLDPSLTATNKSFESLLFNLEEEARLLKMSSAERDTYNKLLKAEEQLGRSLEGTERDQLEIMYERVRAAKITSEVMEDLYGEEEKLIQMEGALRQMREDGVISLEKYRQAMEDVRYESLMLATGITEGEQRALISVKREIMDLATLTENTLVGAFHSAEDALVEFVSTGKANWHDLAQTIFAETSRIIIRMMLLKALGWHGGVGSSSGTTNFQGGLGSGGPGGLMEAQTGGSWKVGGAGGPDSQLVALRASPGERIDVTPPGETRKQDQSQPINETKIINVLDPKMAVNAMGTPAGGKVIMNFIEDNSGTIRRVLGG